MPKTTELLDTYRRLGIDPFDLGCIMLDVVPFDVAACVPDGREDLYFSSNPKLKYAQGDVASSKAHLTLLFGLLEKGPKWKKEVDAVLEGWDQPEAVVVDRIGYFPSSVPGEDYSCIVAHIKPTERLLDANARLRMLPHIDGFPEYKPHVTLAYVKNGPSDVDWARSTREKWIMSMSTRLTNWNLPTLGLNYGGSSD